MRQSLFLLAPLLLVAAPAHATSSASCRGTINPQMRLDLVIGHLAGPVIAQARLHDGGQLVQTGSGGGAMIAQSWLDDDALHLDIVDSGGASYVARLRTWRRGGRGAFTGSLRYGGRQYQVRCQLEG